MGLLVEHIGEEASKMKDVGGEDNQIEKARGEDSMGLLALKRAITLQFVAM